MNCCMYGDVEAKLHVPEKNRASSPSDHVEDVGREEKCLDLDMNVI